MIVTLCRSVCLWLGTLLRPWRLGWGTGFKKVCNIYIDNGCHVLGPSYVLGTMGSPDIHYPDFLTWREVRKPLSPSCYMRKLAEAQQSERLWQDCTLVSPTQTLTLPTTRLLNPQNPGPSRRNWGGFFTPSQDASTGMAPSGQR